MILFLRLDDIRRQSDQMSDKYNTMKTRAGKTESIYDTKLFK